MSVIIKKKRSIEFSSNPAIGAENVSSDGTSFSVILNQPISIPSSAVSCHLGVIDATIWNITNNISASIGNNDFTFTTTAAPAGTYSVTIPDGLYSLSGLNAFLSTAFSNLGLPSNLILLGGDDATQKTILTFLTAGDQVDFTTLTSVRDVLGFSSRNAPSSPEASGWNEFSDTTANFNRVNSYNISTDLINEGIPFNNKSVGIISKVPITSSPGSLINYEPNNILWVNADELIGQKKLNFRFNLLDDSLRVAPTPGEIWSFTITIEYEMLMTKEHVPLMPIG